MNTCRKIQLIAMCILALAVLMVICKNSSAATLEFLSSGDATIKAGYPTKNYGSDTTLRANKYGSSSAHEFLIKFTISGIGTNSVTSAKLVLKCTDGSQQGGAFYKTATFNEQSVTYATAPAAGNLVVTVGTVSSGQSITIDLTSMIQSDGTYTLRVRSSDSNSFFYSSKEGILRAIQWLHITTFDDGNHFPAEGDDIWKIFIINKRYGTTFPTSVGVSPGKMVGYTDFTHK